MNNDEKIKEDRLKLLKDVKESIIEKGNNLSSDFKTTLEVLEFDEKSIKKYQALLNAQELIANLTEEITNANNPEEIANIRKKLNYLINKIKAEIKKRNIEEERLEELQNKTNYLRKDISKYIRFLKRENNINEIEKLNGSINNLSNEDKDQLKKLLYNELRYNKKYLNTENKVEKKEPSKSVSKSSFELPMLKHENKKTVLNLDLGVIRSTYKPKHEKNNSLLNLNFDDIKPAKRDINIEIPKTDITRKNANRHELIDLNNITELEERIKKYKEVYKINRTHEYDKRFGTNIIKLIKNIPIYNSNKKAIKRMEFESSFYAGADFIGFIEYTRKQNSIKQGLKSIFSKTYLFTREGQYLNEHDYCSKWIMNYCQIRDLDINKNIKSLQKA